MAHPDRGAFVPSRHGVPFPNSWPRAPAVSIPTPMGSIGIGNAARGLCGGMVFAALDYWTFRLDPPSSQPAPDAELYKFIVRRLVQSWHVPAGVVKYYQWMSLPDADTRLVIRGRTVTIRGVWRHSIEQEWPRVRALLDVGQPAALGLVTVASANPLLLGENHQALAYGYEVAGSAVSIAVYDPNSGPDDGVRIRFDPSSVRLRRLTHNLNIGRPLRGFFLTAYSPVVPPLPVVSPKP
jgi:hypothetical protein